MDTRAQGRSPWDSPEADLTTNKRPSSDDKIKIDGTFLEIMFSSMIVGTSYIASTMCRGYAPNGLAVAGLIGAVVVTCFYSCLFFIERERDGGYQGSNG